YPFLLDMSGSEPGEMALQSSQAVVFPKFDMRFYTSILTSEELKEAITDYCIPTDLHPRLPPMGLTMNKLPSKYIGIYIEQLEQGGCNPTLSLFRVFYKLHWFSFENKTGGRSKKCYKEVTSSLKGWKKKFFLIDRRAIPDAMPWRHIDTNLRDDFPTHYNENDDARLAEFVVPFRPPPRHLLYVCGLNMTYRHPKLAYNIKDKDGNVITMDAFLKLLVWTEPVKSPTQKNLEKPNSKIDAVREKKDQWNLAKAQAKCAEEEGSNAPRKKRRVPKNKEPDRSGSERTLSPTPLHHVASKNVEEPVTIASNDTAGNATNVEREVVDLSGNTRVTTPSAIVNQPSPRPEHHDTHEHTASDAHSFHSSHHGDTEEGIADRRFVPNWGLRDDLRICTFRACKELISYLATPAEEEFLGNLSNVEVISRAYKLLGQCVLSQGELLKRHEQLNHDYVDLCNRINAHLWELDRLRTGLQREMQVERIRSLEETLKPKSRQLVTAEEQVKVLEGEKAALVAELYQAETDRHKLVREFIPDVVKKLHTSVEYQKSLAAPEAKHRELFTMQYSYIHKVADCYRLPVDAPMKVSPDVPPSAPKDRHGASAIDGTGDAA
ncbi:hypothetical protein Tco_1075015, partial [Tanacetum coccineum]